MKKVFQTIGLFWLLLAAIGIALVVMGLMAISAVRNGGITDFLFMFTDVARFFLIVGIMHTLLGFSLFPLLKAIELKFFTFAPTFSLVDVHKMEKKVKRINHCLHMLSFSWMVLTVIGVGSLVFGLYIKNVMQSDELFGYSPACMFFLCLGYALVVFGVTLTPIGSFLRRRGVAG